MYVQALETDDSLRVVGQRHLVSRHGARCLRWRSDGKDLGADGRVYAVPVKLRPTVCIGVPLPLFTISTKARAAVHAFLGFDVSADGSRFVIPVVSSPEKPSLVVVQNWLSTLARKPD